MPEDADLRDLAASGQKITAIKLYRERYGVGLAEARDAIEALAAGHPVPPPSPWPDPHSAADPDFWSTVRELAVSGNKLMAIKLYRERYGVGLAEAKDAIEALAAGRPVAAPPAPAAVSLEEEDFWPVVDELLASGHKIEAIKRYRERFGTGLKEAKDAIDARVLRDPRLQVKSGCFIATAAFGTPLAPEVEMLRSFRDRVLLPHPAGRAFTRSYYRWSPAIARRLSRSEPARALVRALLRPAIRLLRGVVRNA